MALTAAYATVNRILVEEARGGVVTGLCERHTKIIDALVSALRGLAAQVGLDACTYGAS